MPKIEKIPIEKLHTRQLLSFLKQKRIDAGRFFENYGCGDPSCDYCYEEYNKYKNTQQLFEFYSVKELKAELAKRPHIPNKKESRLLRIERKKKGESRKNIK